MTASCAQPNPLESLSNAVRGLTEAVSSTLARLPQFDLPRRNVLPPLQPRPPRPSAPTPTPSPSFPGARSAAAAAASSRVTKEDLGRATWTLLHTVAASLPQNPSRSQRRAFSSLIHSLAELYPCAECADHFSKIVDARPPERAAAAGGEGARQWCCEAHNDVNEKLGKPRFDCSLANARWSSLDCEVDGRSGCELVVGPGGASRRRGKA